MPKRNDFEKDIDRLRTLLISLREELKDTESTNRKKVLARLDHVFSELRKLEREMILTSTEREVLKIIEQIVRKGDVPATIDAIAKARGVSYHSVYHDVQTLKNLKIVEKTKGKGNRVELELTEDE